MNKALVLNPDRAHFSNLSRVLFESSVVFSQNYLSFLHNLEGGVWDSVYITYDLTRYAEHDSWLDGAGYRKAYNGLHAARAIASMSELGLCKVNKVFLDSSSAFLQEISNVLTASNVNVVKYSVKDEGDVLLLHDLDDSIRHSRS